MRQIVLDTETTGLSPKSGHRLTEIGCVELIDRCVTGNTYQTYINPEREVSEKAAEITGLTWEKLKDYPTFPEIADDFLAFIQDAELIIHNAPFDLGFIAHELKRMSHSYGPLESRAPVIDTLLMARDQFPGQRNSLDALCQRLMIDNSQRTYHGALLDSEILAEVYLAMTAGQTSFELNTATPEVAALDEKASAKVAVQAAKKRTRVVFASALELCEHEKMLKTIDEASDGSVWRKLE